MTEPEFVRGTWVPQSYLEPLGKLFVWFCLLEESVDRALAIFAQTDKRRGELIVKQFTSFAAKTDLLLLLAQEQLDVTHLSKFKTVIKQATDANTSRNEIVHGRWSYADFYGDTEVKKESLTKSGARKTTAITVAAIDHAAKAAYDAQVALDASIIAWNMRAAPIW